MAQQTEPCHIPEESMGCRVHHLCWDEIHFRRPLHHLAIDGNHNLMEPNGCPHPSNFVCAVSVILDRCVCNGYFVASALFLVSGTVETDNNKFERLPRLSLPDTIANHVRPDDSMDKG